MSELLPEVMEAMAAVLRKRCDGVAAYQATALEMVLALPACVLVSDGQGNVTFSTSTDEWMIAVCSRCGRIDGEWVCNCHSDREFLAPLPHRKVEDVPVVRAPGRPDA